MVITEREEAANGRLTDLIIQARQGDNAAWELLVRQHQEAAFRLAYLIVGDAAEAEEAAQDAFVRAYLSLDQFDTERPFRPWLLAIVANLARNRRRSWGRYWGMIQRWWQAKEATPENIPQDEADLLWQAVQKLRPAAQEIIYLRYFLELSEAETADTLQIRPGTVKSRLHRALQQLRAIIETDFAELAEDRK
ncbi:MAG: RNA polymerase sigma factor [Ardenticatenaceae bacterium]|nr:RNA polymerase sigma factor [Ardenticatenaceae bacterium]